MNLARRASIYLYGWIGTGPIRGITARSISRRLKKLSPKTDLDIFISSRGGDYFEGIAIHNILCNWRGKKTVHITGVAAGIASLIALVGDAIVINPKAVIMMCDPTINVIGGSEDFKQAADICDKVRNEMIRIYVERTGRSRKQISADMKAERWLTAEAAMASGF